MTEISTSILDIKDNNIINTIFSLEKAKTDYFHIDVMDGRFVKDSTNDKMIKYCECITNITTVPLDIHLMVENIKECIDDYSIFNPNIITFHYEACKDKDEISNLIKYIKEKRIRVGIALKPDTKVEDIYEFLPYIHLVLIMTVEPGKGGQELIENTISKIKKLKNYTTQNNIDIDIEADGGINQENSKILTDAGTDILVSGSGILNSKNYEETIRKLKNK